MDLIQNLINTGYLTNTRIISAFRAVKRQDFLPQNMPSREARAELDEALPIGFGQTVSQPAVVAFMLELLDPKPGQNILDVGYGSGWTTALLAQIACQNGKKGKVTAIERIPELADFGKKNIAKYGFIKNKTAHCITGNGYAGYPQNAPYDRILSGAAAAKIPQAWIDQLKNGGIIVAPVKNAVARLVKNNCHDINQKSFEGFAFVPLVKNNN